MANDLLEHSEIVALVERSRRLGADPRVTNFGGGNTSAKVGLEDPITGETRRVLVVKGSGGDLGTLKPEGLALVDLERLRTMERAYQGLDQEDEMVGLLDYARFGPGGAVPSIDTPLHGFLPANHVDHLHPDSLIAFATAADGRERIEEAFGGRLGWLDWQRPGFDLGLKLRDTATAQPDLVGVVLGGHGVISWAETSQACEALSRDLIAEAERYLAEHGRPSPFGAERSSFATLPEDERRRRAAALSPAIRGLASTDRRMIGHFTDSGVVLDFLASVRPLLLDLPADASLDEQATRLRELHSGYRDDYRRYYEENATPESPPMRGADPAIVLVPGIGMWSFGADAQTARVAGEFYVNAINVMHGAEALSSYSPIPDSEKFRVEYWELEERKLRMRPAAPSLSGAVAFVTGAASGIGLAIAKRLHGLGAAVVIADLDSEGAEREAETLGDPDRAVAVQVDVADEQSVGEALEAACLRFGGVDIVVNNAGLASSAPLLETEASDYDRLHSVMGRGSFLVSRTAARILIDQGIGGDIVYVASKNAVVAGPNNVAYGSVKAAQAHQVRLLAAELGPHRIRVNGVNPDAVVRGSGIFAGGWAKERAEAYGVPVEDLGRFYAERTLLKTEILPEHIADAVAALVGGDFSVTTGSFVPVDGGIPAAFPR
jgi:rhamnose utilization protein RhaD (predicted bifunctional aldolase and dehydrogenase)/NAD(P)-dependent dehydrogenase (short-subunit alcohol dehydrogenase family)